jgi:hypothetical protein
MITVRIYSKHTRFQTRFRPRLHWQLPSQLCQSSRENSEILSKKKSWPLFSGPSKFTLYEACTTRQKSGASLYIGWAVSARNIICSDQGVIGGGSGGGVTLWLFGVRNIQSNRIRSFASYEGCAKIYKESVLKTQIYYLKLKKISLTGHRKFLGRPHAARGLHVVHGCCKQ